VADVRCQRFRQGVKLAQDVFGGENGVQQISQAGQEAAFKVRVLQQFAQQEGTLQQAFIILIEDARFRISTLSISI